MPVEQVSRSQARLRSRRDSTSRLESPVTTTDVRTADDQLMQGIDTLDLSMISLKLQDPEEGLGWSQSYCQTIAVEYGRYLALSRRYPERAIVPSKIVDNFWHFHILDTQAYEKDCAQLFGFFLHHFPYFGMRGPEDAQVLGDAYDETLRLYAEHFGPAPERIWARTGAARCPNCGNRCK